MSGRKRRTEEANPPGNSNNESDQDQGAEFERRRRAAADVARRRAAHFAQYADEPADNNNVHAGLPGDAARNLGPFSTATALLQARDRAIEQRKQHLLYTHAIQNNTAAHPPWQPSRDASSLGKRTIPPPTTTNHVNNNNNNNGYHYHHHQQQHTGPPSLSTLALQVITQYIDCVESLNGIPDGERSRISARLRATRSLTPNIFLLFTADAPQELVIHDCTNLDPDVLETGLVRTAAAGVSSKLQRVELGLCGRGFTPKVAEAFASALTNAAAAGGGTIGGGKDKGAPSSSSSSSSSSKLTHLTLSGAYLLNDKGLLSILKASPNLTALSLPQACRLIASQQNSSINMLPRLCPHLRELNLNECRGIDSDGLHQALSGLLPTTLEELSLDGLGGQITDDFMASLLPPSSLSSSSSSTLFPKLRHASFARCTELTDKGLLDFVGRAPCLESLVLDECKGITSLGFMHMFGTTVIDCSGGGDDDDDDNGDDDNNNKATTTAGALAAAVTTKPLAVVPPFKTLKLKKCQVDDSVIYLLALKCPDLTTLSLNGCKQITSASIRALSQAACRSSLQYLDLSWCRQVSQEALGALADACPRLETLVLWGCGGNQVGRLFLDGHSNDKLTVIGCGEEEGAV